MLKMMPRYAQEFSRTGMGQCKLFDWWLIVMLLLFLLSVCWMLYRVSHALGVFLLHSDLAPFPSLAVVRMRSHTRHQIFRILDLYLLLKLTQWWVGKPFWFVKGVDTHQYPASSLLLCFSIKTEDGCSFVIVIIPSNEIEKHVESDNLSSFECKNKYRYRNQQVKALMESMLNPFKYRSAFCFHK